MERWPLAENVLPSKGDSNHAKPSINCRRNEAEADEAAYNANMAVSLRSCTELLSTHSKRTEGCV